MKSKSSRKYVIPIKKPRRKQSRKFGRHSKTPRRKQYRKTPRRKQSCKTPRRKQSRKVGRHITPRVKPTSNFLSIDNDDRDYTMLKKYINNILQKHNIIDYPSDAINDNYFLNDKKLNLICWININKFCITMDEEIEKDREMITINYMKSIGELIHNSKFGLVFNIIAGELNIDFENLKNNSLKNIMLFIIRTYFNDVNIQPIIIKTIYFLTIIIEKYDTTMSSVFMEHIATEQTSENKHDDGDPRSGTRNLDLTSLVDIICTRLFSINKKRSNIIVSLKIQLSLFISLCINAIMIQIAKKIYDLYGKLQETNMSEIVNTLLIDTGATNFLSKISNTVDNPRKGSLYNPMIYGASSTIRPLFAEFKNHIFFDILKLLLYNLIKDPDITSEILNQSIYIVD